MSKPKLNLRRFNMQTQMSWDKTICVCARRNSGKSVLIRDIMYHNRDIPAAVVICPTEIGFNRSYGHHIPDSYIYKQFSGSIIQRIFSRQRQLMMAKNLTKEHSTILLVMDDCAHDANSWLKDDGIKEIFTNGRHYKIMYITAILYVSRNAYSPCLNGDFSRW